MSTAEAAKQVEDGSLDFVFIDADHSYEGVKADIEAWDPKVREGGYVIGHDYDFPKWWGKQVKQAVDEIYGEKVKTGPDNLWYIKK
jgi:predicted O-methyltransferase YrrM